MGHYYLHLFKVFLVVFEIDGIVLECLQKYLTGDGASILYINTILCCSVYLKKTEVNYRFIYLQSWSSEMSSALETNRCAILHFDIEESRHITTLCTAYGNLNLNLLVS